MKMYEKMGIDPTTKEGVKKIMILDCMDIPDKDGSSKQCKYPSHDSYTCVNCKAARLFAEVPIKKIKRYEKYDGDFLEASRDFHIECFNQKCGNCRFNGIEKDHFCLWLMEEIEVKE